MSMTNNKGTGRKMHTTAYSTIKVGREAITSVDESLSTIQGRARRAAAER